MKIHQLLVNENQAPIGPLTIDDVPGLKEWLVKCQLDESIIEVHQDKSITINGEFDYFPIGTGPTTYVPTVIRRVNGNVTLFIENTMFEDAPKLNLNKWLKEVDGYMMVNMYDPAPILSLMRIRCSDGIMLGYHTADEDGENHEIDENLGTIFERAYANRTPLPELQEELIDAGYGKFARL